MKKTILIAVCILVAILLVIALLPVKIDCGDSQWYTLAERRAAAELIAARIRSFEGCRLFAVRYDGDDISQNNLDYCNELVSGEKTYTDCVVFTSYFRSPIFGGGAWNANQLYSWSWCLARTEAEDWEIVAFGYA